MGNVKKELSFKDYKILAVLVLLLGGFLISGWFMNSQSSDQAKPLNSFIAKTVSAQEIYSLFICPCCGKPIDTRCCSMSKERVAYVDGLARGGLAKDEAIMAYVKKYGLDSFRDEDEKEVMKEKLAKEAPSDRPIIQIEPSFYDLGDVSQEEGTVTAIFEIRNIGSEDLIISRLETSCGCTSVSIVYQEKEGPKFTMVGHDINEEAQDWQVTILSNDIAQLKVYYDPNTHEDFRGTAIRDIYLFSNDPVEFKKKVTIELSQVD